MARGGVVLVLGVAGVVAAAAGAIGPRSARATPVTYSNNDYSNTPGYRGWSYWDSLGQQMVWNTGTQRWTCLNPLDAWCYWATSSGHPGADRNIVRRWTAPAAGSVRITGTTQKDANVCGGTLVSVGKPSTQSSCDTGCFGGIPSRCNDGNTDGSWSNGSVCHTNYEAQPWYQIDLLAPTQVSRIDVWNRSDDSGAHEAARTTNFNVMTSLTAAAGSWTIVNHPETAGFPTTTRYDMGTMARYVRVQLVGTNYLNLAEVQVYADGPDGVETYYSYQSQQANYYLTYTLPGPLLTRSYWIGAMACSDTTARTFDYDQEVYPGDTLSFVIDRRNNYSWDSTSFAPTLTFEQADAIGSLEKSSGATPTSATVAFDGFLKCPNGTSCNYTSTVPPDYYTVQQLGPSTGNSPPATTFNNFAPCGPADGPNCVRLAASPNFAKTYSGLNPNAVYTFKVRAYRAGHLYGRSQMIALATGLVPPQPLSPVVSVVGPSPEYGARDAVISWQQPSPPLDRPAAMQRLELYRQALSSKAPVPMFGPFGNGDVACSLLSGAAGEYSCVSSSLGSCSASGPLLIAGCALWDPPVRIGYSRWDNNNVLQNWVSTAEQASPTRRTDLSTSVVTSVTDPGVDRKPTTYRYSLVARYNANYAAPAVTSEMTAKAVLPRAATIAGFADTHVHQFGNLAHGGRLLDGRPGDANDGSETFNGTAVDMGGFLANASGPALRGCDAVATGGSGNHDFGAIGNIVLNAAGFGHDKSGIKDMPLWLDHSNSLHQQVYKTALKRAVDGGLRLIVMHAVNSEGVCKMAAFVRGGGQSPIPCDDATSSDRQIQAAYRLQSEIDLEYCPGSPIPTVGLPNTHLSNEAPDYQCGWYRIVTNPAAARKVMRAGKLAVVLGIEAATPFNCGTGTTGTWAGGNATNWSGVPGMRGTCMIGGGPVSGIVDILDPLDGMSLQYFYDQGVRHIFPIHGNNNGIGSTAISNASDRYGLIEAALNGSYFRPMTCRDRGAGLDPPLTFSLAPLASVTTLTLPLGAPTPFGTPSLSLTIGGLAGIPFAPAGYPGITGATCNAGGAFGSTAPPFGLTPLGKRIIQEMMKKRMLIDVDHMSELSHVDTVAESAKAFNYPLVSGHTNLQRLSTGAGSPGESEFALSTPELNEVRASGGQVNLVALGAFPTSGVASHVRLGNFAASSQFLPRVSSVANDCSDSSKPWAQEYLAAVDLTRNAPMPNDNSAPPVFGVGFGSDINTIHTMLQPRFGFVGGGWSGCSPPSGPTTAMNAEQQAQWDAQIAGLPGRAVPYNVDMISGLSTTNGYGGMNTSVCVGSTAATCGDPANGFPGFMGPRLRRSRLNEGGYLFTLYGPDKPVNGSPQGTVPTMCLDDAGSVNDGDAPAIGGCGNTRNINQQWAYDPSPSQRIRPLAHPAKNLVVTMPLQAVNNSNEFAVTYADSNVFGDYSHPAPEATWTTLATGQLFNALSGRCLSVQGSGYGQGARVVVAACTAGNTGLALRPDQMWARGGEEESFNLTGLSHIGMYPDLIQDLKDLGLTPRDLIPLFQSAEGYLEMWERTGWTKPIEYSKLSSDGTWKYTTVTPPSGWQGAAFDDAAWRVVGDDASALAAYGAAPWGTGIAGFPSPTPARWLPVAAGNATAYFRKTFVTDATGGSKTVTISCDNSADVYLDGQPRGSFPDWTNAGTFSLPVTSFGTHVIAIACTNAGGPGGLLVDVR